MTNNKFQKINKYNKNEFSYKKFYFEKKLEIKQTAIQLKIIHKMHMKYLQIIAN